MVSSSSFFPEFHADKIEPETAPRFVVGATSPLWLMFGGAAVAGAAYWWWASRWREAVNLEAVLALAPEPVAPATEAEAEAILAAAPEPVVEAVTEAVETAEVVLDAVEEAVETLAEASTALVEAATDATLDAVEEVVEPIVAVEADPAPAVPEVVAAEAAPVELAVAEPPTDATLAAAGSEALAAADDLTRLVGVGPKLAASLAELGVTTFGQIAAWTPEDLADIDLKLGLKGRAERDAWIAQAKRFAAAVEATAV
jgi:predicted flap endonuclease-1-like 5' DNA nuclease